VGTQKGGKGAKGGGFVQSAGLLLESWRLARNKTKQKKKKKTKQKKTGYWATGAG